MLFQDKCVVRFAYFPIRIDDTIVWLERYEAVYRYMRDSFWDFNYWELQHRNIIK